MAAIGVTKIEDLIQVGVKLYNCQMGGMLLGGIVLGDSRR